MKSSVIVVGAGWAGISAAVHLARQGFQVTLLEKHPFPGGRAFSFKDPVTGTWIDNGQHVLMGCYSETLAMIKTLGTGNGLLALPPLRTVWISKDGQRHILDASGSPYSWALLRGLWKLDTLAGWDKWKLIQAFRRIKNISSDQSRHLDQISCLRWLEELKQTPSAITNFWEPLILATLNAKPADVAASGLLLVFGKALLQGSFESRMLVPKTCLLDLIHPAAQKMLESLGGSLRFQSAVQSISVSADRVTAVELRDNPALTADAYVLALDPQSLTSLLPDRYEPLAEIKSLASGFSYSPIISIYVWIKGRVLDDPVIGLLGSPLHWIFNKSPNSRGDQLLCGVISAAEQWKDTHPSEIKKHLLWEFSRYLHNFSSDRVIHIRLIHERRATVLLKPGTRRPPVTTALPNLFIAGSWTDTGLPATIEGAVLSGRLCAEAVKKFGVSATE